MDIASANRTSCPGESGSSNSPEWDALNSEYGGEAFSRVAFRQQSFLGKTILEASFLRDAGLEVMTRDSYNNVRIVEAVEGSELIFSGCEPNRKNFREIVTSFEQACDELSCVKDSIVFLEELVDCALEKVGTVLKKGQLFLFLSSSGDEYLAVVTNTHDCILECLLFHGKMENYDTFFKFSEDQPKKRAMVVGSTGMQPLKRQFIITTTIASMIDTALVETGAQWKLSRMPECLFRVPRIDGRIEFYRGDNVEYLNLQRDEIIPDRYSPTISPHFLAATVESQEGVHVTVKIAHEGKEITHMVHLSEGLLYPVGTAAKLGVEIGGTKGGKRTKDTKEVGGPEKFDNEKFRGYAELMMNGDDERPLIRPICIRNVHDGILAECVFLDSTDSESHLIPLSNPRLFPAGFASKANIPMILDTKRIDRHLLHEIFTEERSGVVVVGRKERAEVVEEGSGTTARSDDDMLYDDGYVSSWDKYGGGDANLSEVVHHDNLDNAHSKNDIPLDETLVDESRDASIPAAAAAEGEIEMGRHSSNIPPPSPTLPPQQLDATTPPSSIPAEAVQPEGTQMQSTMRRVDGGEKAPVKSAMRMENGGTDGDSEIEKKKEGMEDVENQPPTNRQESVDSSAAKRREQIEKEEKLINEKLAEWSVEEKKKGREGRKRSYVSSELAESDYEFTAPKNIKMEEPSPTGDSDQVEGNNTQSAVDMVIDETSSMHIASPSVPTPAPPNSTPATGEGTTVAVHYIWFPPSATASTVLQSSHEGDPFDAVPLDKTTTSTKEDVVRMPSEIPSVSGADNGIMNEESMWNGREASENDNKKDDSNSSVDEIPTKRARIEWKEEENGVKNRDGKKEKKRETKRTPLDPSFNSRELPAEIIRRMEDGRSERGGIPRVPSRSNSRSASVEDIGLISGAEELRRIKMAQTLLELGLTTGEKKTGFEFLDAELLSNFRNPQEWSSIEVQQFVEIMDFREPLKEHLRIQDYDGMKLLSLKFEEILDDFPQAAGGGMDFTEKVFFHGLIDKIRTVMTSNPNITFVS